MYEAIIVKRQQEMAPKRIKIPKDRIHIYPSAEPTRAVAQLVSCPAVQERLSACLAKLQDVAEASPAWPPPGPVFDSHCHLDFIRRRMRCGPAWSLEDSLARDGLQLGSSFAGCVANFCDPVEWRAGLSPTLRVAAADRRVLLAFGCHPHFAASWGVEMERRLRDLLTGRAGMSGRLVALGECGLDYSAKNRVGRNQQMEVFAAQLRLALELRLPLVLHIRNAETDGQAVLEQEKVPENWPMHRHCFCGDAAAAEAWLARWPASKIGVTGLVTWSPAARALLDAVPLDRLLLETDAPYFLPKGVAGQADCSQPGHVLYVARKVAAFKGVDLEVVLQQNLRNVEEVYQVAVDRPQPAVRTVRASLAGQTEEDKLKEKIDSVKLRTRTEVARVKRTEVVRVQIVPPSK